MIREIVQKGLPILRKECEIVTDFSSINDIIQDLKDTIRYLKTTHEFKR